MIAANALAVGRRKAEFMRSFLVRERIPLLSDDLGGTTARKVYLFGGAGAAQVKYLHELRNETVAERDAMYHRMLSAAPRFGEAQLFD